MFLQLINYNKIYQFYHNLWSWSQRASLIYHFFVQFHTTQFPLVSFYNTIRIQSYRDQPFYESKFQSCRAAVPRGNLPFQCIQCRETGQPMVKVHFYARSYKDLYFYFPIAVRYDQTYQIGCHLDLTTRFICDALTPIQPTLASKYKYNEGSVATFVLRLVNKDVKGLIQRLLKDGNKITQLLTSVSLQLSQNSYLLMVDGFNKFVYVNLFSLIIISFVLPRRNTIINYQSIGKNRIFEVCQKQSLKVELLHHLSSSTTFTAKIKIGKSKITKDKRQIRCLKQDLIQSLKQDLKTC